MIDRKKYSEYFVVDDNYFPQINDSAIIQGEKSDPDFWMRTFPHPSFIEMLNNIEKILSHTVKRSLWIEGAYGVGKSQCSYALRRILEVPEEKLRKYWNKYDPLKNSQKNTDLFKRLCGHKSRKIVTAYRYSSSDVDTDRKLYMAIQESVKKALQKAGCSYLGENTLKESVIAWLEDETHRSFFDDLLKNKYSSTFSQRSCEEVLSDLRDSEDVQETMENVFRLADAEGVTILNIDVNRLCSWLRDVVTKNEVRVVFVWDEFSDYFKRRKDYLSGFQKTTELYGEIDFFFIPITHESNSIFGATNQYWKKIKDRFLFSRIQMPDNVAFDLIAYGIKTNERAEKEWEPLSNDLNSRLSTSREAVAKAAKIVNQDVMRRILPLHPMTALVLKHISTVFQSNQRSMFDFVKSSDKDVEAFQWFIANHGPYSDVPLLTVAMLWNFFYEQGRSNLTPSVRAVLDGYEKREKHLRDDEKVVLKAILILQALDSLMDTRFEIFHPTKKNLSLVFDGCPRISGSRSGNIADQMVKNGVLFKKPIDAKTEVYSVESISGDVNKLENKKKQIRDSFTTSKGIDDGKLCNALALPPALRLRFEETPDTGYTTAVCDENFTRKSRELRDKSQNDWRFKLLVCFAKDSHEGSSFHIKIKEAAKNSENSQLVFVDATSTTLDSERFEEYVAYAANSVYYQEEKDPQAAREHNEKATQILKDWCNSFEKGRFVVYYDGKDWIADGLQGLYDVLQEIVTSRFPMTFDFKKGLTENQYKHSTMVASAKCGIVQKTNGSVANIERHTFPAGVWNVEKYWEILPKADISQIKRAVDDFIFKSFQKDGQVSIPSICVMLENKYGFANCNLYSFLIGFLLKEYGLDGSLRYADAFGAQEEMSPEKLAEAVGKYLNGQHLHETRIVKQTAEEQAFYKTAIQGWNVSANCKSPQEVVASIEHFLNERGFPLQFLESAVSSDQYKLAFPFVTLCQGEGESQLNVARQIGKTALDVSDYGLQLKETLSYDNFQRGAENYLRRFDDGKLWALSEKIGARLLADAKSRFQVKHQSLWNEETQQDEIRKLEVEYEFAYEINQIFNVRSNSLESALQEIRESFKWIQVSHETVVSHKPELKNFVETAYKICLNSKMLPDVLKSTLYEIQTRRDAIKRFFDEKNAFFVECYEPYLEGLNENEIQRIIANLGSSMFEMSSSKCNSDIKNAAEVVRKNQKKTTLINFWRDKTQTRDPRDWSERFKTPVLCLVSDDEYEEAKQTFETLNNLDSQNETSIQHAQSYLERASFFDVLKDEACRRKAFEEKILKTSVARKLISYERALGKLEKLGLEAYRWYPNPNVDAEITRLVKIEYDAGGSDKVLAALDKMDAMKLREYLRRLVRENYAFGLEILCDLEE